MIAGSDMANGSASSLTESASRPESRASSARRVGSDSAAKVRSRIWFWSRSLYLTIWFSIGMNRLVSSVVHHGFGQQSDMALGAIIAAELAKGAG